ncbi:HAD-IA family hydrolase [Zobellella aerophila]|uniref:HAD-IA family hydrolase n=1 Tax=Zobellella aerophila TaxID=870480 RepID=A0ABP6V679_9GAMM
MQTKAVLFDLDGTLLDTAGDMGAAANHVIQGLGLPPLSDDIIRSTTSDGSYALLQAGIHAALIEQLGLEQLRRQMLDYYALNLCVHTRPYRGIPAVIDWLDARRIPWGIVTNKPSALTLPLLASLPQFARCGVTVSADTLPRKKPHPDPLLYAADCLTVAPGHCLYIGDHQRDVEAGRAAGMATAVAAWGYIAADAVLPLWQADHIIDSVQDFGRWLEDTFDTNC